jgi:outer membrane receptor for ferrienterochelin and colicin
MFMNTTLTYSDYRLSTDIKSGTLKVNGGTGRNEVGLNYLSGIEDYGAKVDFDYVPSPSHFVKFGINTINHTFKPGKFNLRWVDTERNIDFNESVGQSNIKAQESNIYIEDDWDVFPKFKINAGLHFSAFNLKKSSYYSLQPRLSSRYLLPKDWALKASFATMRQYINLLAFEGIGLPTDLWLPATDRIAPQDSWQVAVSTAKTINDQLEFSVEGYYKKMKNLIAYKDGAGVFQTDDWQNRVIQGEGDAYGAELFIQKKSGKLSGWIGYTLSWTYRNFKEINDNKPFPYRFDRRHDISVVASYEFSEKFNIAATWVYGTGNAVTLPNSKYNDSDIINRNFIYSIQVFDERNNYRLRPYHRGDIGVNFVKKHKKFKRTISIGAYNVYANNNPFYIYIETVGTSIDNGPTIYENTLKQTSLFPFIPYLTFSWDF